MRVCSGMDESVPRNSQAVSGKAPPEIIMNGACTQVFRWIRQGRGDGRGEVGATYRPHRPRNGRIVRRMGARSRAEEGAARHHTSRAALILASGA